MPKNHVTENDPSASIAQVLLQTLISPNESDSNLEAANVVDGLFAIARSLGRVAKAIEETKTKEENKINIK